MIPHPSHRLFQAPCILLALALCSVITEVEPLGAARCARGQEPRKIEPVVQEITRLWEKRQRAIRTAIFRAEGVGILSAGFCSGIQRDKTLPRTPAQDFVYKMTVTLYLDFERNRVRNETVTRLCGNMQFDGTIEPHVLNEVYIWDGANFIHYLPPEKNPSLRPDSPHVYVGYPPEVGLGPEVEFAFFAAGVLTTRAASPTMKQLRVRPDSGMYRVIGTATHQGRECVVLRSDVVKGAWYDVWVDVAHDAAITRYIWYTRSLEQPVMTADVEYGPQAGTWMPKKCRVLHYNDKILLNNVDCELNAPLDPQLFRVRVEKGMRIQSGVLDRVFVAPRAGDALQVQPGPSDSEGEEPRRFHYVLYVTLAVLLGLAIRMLVAVRSRKRR